MSCTLCSSAALQHAPQPSCAAAARRCGAAPPARGATMRLQASANGNGAGNGAAPRPRSLSTMLVHSEGLVDDQYGASMPPIYQTATFAQPGATEMGEYDYNRSGNPTRTVLEKQLAALEVGGWRRRWARYADRNPRCSAVLC